MTERKRHVKVPPLRIRTVARKTTTKWLLDQQAVPLQLWVTLPSIVEGELIQERLGWSCLNGKMDLPILTAAQQNRRRLRRKMTITGIKEVNRTDGRREVEVKEALPIVVIAAKEEERLAEVVEEVEDAGVEEADEEVAGTIVEALAANKV